MADKPTCEELEQRIKELGVECAKPEQAEEALRESEEKYRSMMEAMNMPVYICSPDFRITYVNPAMISRTGRDATGEPCYKAINALDEKCPWCVHEQIQQGEYVETEVVSPKDGRTYHVSHAPVFHVDGSVSKMTIYTDITEHYRAEEALHQSEERYRDLYEKAPNAYFSVSAAEGTVLRCNFATKRLLGYDKETITGMKILDLYADTPEGKAKAKEVFKRFKTGESVRDVELQMKHRNGYPIWINLCVEPVRDRGGNVIESRSMAVDISERRQAEEALRKARDELEQRVEERTAELAEVNEQLKREIEERKRAKEALQKSEAELRRLSSRLLEVQETERKRVAGELHDSIGQSLAAIKFGLENTLSRISYDSAKESVESLEALILVVQRASEEVRQIHTNLRPSMLDDLGIISTISWFCREFDRVYSSVKIEKQIGVEEKEVPENLKIIIFRVLQEAMNNISKHGKADLVRVFLKGTNGKLELVVEDNGQGFDVEHVPSMKTSKEGFGLTSMKERTELSGGTFAIESTPGAGTVVRASWPV